MSALQFELLDERQARIILERPSYQAEAYGDRIRAARRLQPVTSPAERAEVREFHRVQDPAVIKP